MKKIIIVFVSFFITFLIISNTTAVSNTNTISEKSVNKINKENIKNINFEKKENIVDILKEKIGLKYNTGIFEFLIAWIITWAIIVVDFFETFHPIAFKLMEILERPILISLFFPMTYVLFVVAFFKVLFE